MEFTPKYQIYLADPLGFSDNPFIVTTAYTNIGGYPKGEWFLVVPEEKGKLFAQKTRLDCKTFPEGPVVFDEEFLLNDMLEQAKLKLRAYIFETNGEKALGLLSKRLDVLPSNQNLFVNFWLHGNYRECLAQIQQKTECGPLAEFLGWVLDLPALSVRDL